MYSQITNAIEVTVQPAFLTDHSQPESGVYVWTYEVTISNHSTASVRLLRRHWRITNAFGQTTDVKGDGVVGNQPLIPPGATFNYSSFANLPTASGIMVGTYDMTSENGDLIIVAIPAFSLDSPDQLARPN
ncbi:MAG: Co2+/Mg2+ efflux protein ApaG [Deltaproteobacteria bacterium]|nr:Co2+/Mg2+ efflux protein ApaG [Deltaproteobacteria bacterium]